MKTFIARRFVMWLIWKSDVKFYHPNIANGLITLRFESVLGSGLISNNQTIGEWLLCVLILTTLYTCILPNILDFARHLWCRINTCRKKNAYEYWTFVKDRRL